VPVIWLQGGASFNSVVYAVGQWVARAIGEDINGDLFDCLKDGNILAGLASKLNSKTSLRPNSKAKPGL